MRTRVAVITDAVSQDFIFPIWYRYYSGLFGAQNIFIVTYAGLSLLFREFALGGLIELPVGYDDTTRRAVISQFVSSLLPCYDAVIRVDCDEFLVVDPRSAASLAAFVDGLDAPYMTARGFDVIQMPDEPPLPEKPDASILKDRAFAYPNTALNKTCIVKTPVTWSAGFHAASVYPKFGPLVMLHMKRLDIGWQVGWFSHMFENIKDNPKVDKIFKDYYTPDKEKIRNYHRDVTGRPRLSGIDSWYRHDLTKNFLEKTRFVPSDGLYYSDFDHEMVLCEIPREWKSLL
jgi:hypothetical protein